MPITHLENTIQEYAWGSRTFIAELLGQPAPSPAPWAELWMGAHPKAPSHLLTPDGGRISLQAAIEADPEALLGAACARRFNNQLPFLFKVLSAAEPLSIQAHPNQAQAQQGFAHENAAAIPLDSARRNYRDASHKPELITALTPFYALCGFRPVSESLSLLQAVCGHHLNDALTGLQQPPPAHGLSLFLERLLTLSETHRQAIVTHAAKQAALLRGDDAFAWVVKIQRFYPRDIGILAPLFLNLIVLQPPQALYLPAGELHAYLEGSAIEIMANSDNVIRGGLTPKHVDVPELLRILTFSAGHREILLPQAVSDHVSRYNTPAAEFQLDRIEATGDVQIPLHSAQIRILLCTAGGFILKTSEQQLSLNKGASVLLPASTAPASLSGCGVCYMAGAP